MIELRCNIAPHSAMESNVFAITRDGGAYIGDITITDSSLLKHLGELMKDRAVQMRTKKKDGTFFTKGDKEPVMIKLPITLIMKPR